VTDDRGAKKSTTRDVVVVVAVNQRPVAAFEPLCKDLACAFDATTSSDSDGSVAGYAWDFGDGGSGTGKSVAHTYSAAGSFVVKLTVTDDKGATDSVSKTVVVSSAATVAADTFTRTGSQWGSAETGGTWTLASSSAFSTDGKVGNVKLASAGSSATAALNAASAKDLTMTADLAVDKVATGNGVYVGLAARKNGNTFYTLKVRFMSDSTLHLAESRTVDNTETTIREVAISGVTYSPGDVLRVKFTVSGSTTATLVGKVWKGSAAEPTNAQISVTDSTAALQSAGSLAVSTYLSGTSTNAPVKVSIDNLLAVKP